MHWSWFLLLLITIDINGDIGKMLFDFTVLISVFGFVVIHEFGHILAARKYGVNCERVTLMMLGGMAHIDDSMEDLEPKKQLWVTFAGPLTNLIMMLIFFLIILFTVDLNGVTDLELLSNTTKFLVIGFTLNFIMLVFNLLPIYPMDGGRLLRSGLELYKVKASQIISIRVTQVFCVLLLIFSIWQMLIVGILISVLFFLMASFEISKLKKEILEYELAKCWRNHEEDASNMDTITKDIINIGNLHKAGKLWKKTDYVQRKNKNDSGEDN
jgi:Zn-dependent protease